VRAYVSHIGELCCSQIAIARPIIATGRLAGLRNVRVGKKLGGIYEKTGPSILQRKGKLLMDEITELSAGRDHRGHQVSKSVVG
jgi:hypothetical protein